MTFYDLNNLVDYNYWARDRVLDAVSALTLEQFTCDLGNSFSSVRDTVAHICDAEYIWVTRWRGGQPIGFQKAERIADVASARAEWMNLEAGVREFVRELGPAGVERVIEYKDFRVAIRSNAFWEMLQHVVNHGSYHRGQITTMLRQLGAKPPQYMDMIVFYRERQSKS